MDIDSQDRNTRGWLILGLLLLGLLLLLCTCNNSRGIENRLQVVGEAALAETGLEPGLLRVGGRDAFLAGEVSSNEARQEAEQILGTVPGIRKVFNNLNVVEPVVETPEPEPIVALREPSLKVCMNDCSVALSGLLSQDGRNEVLSAVNSLCSAENVVSDISVAEDVAPAPWLTGLIGLLPRINDDLTEGCIDASAEGLALTGQVASEALKAELASLAGASVDLAIVDGLELVAPELLDPNLNFRLADNKIELRGLVPESSIAPTVAAASQIVGDENVVNNLTAEDNVAAPDWFANVIDRLPVFASAVQTPELDIANNTVTLRGVVASEEEKTQFGNTFADAAGVGVAVVNDLQVVAPLPDAALNVKMVETGLELRGTLPQDLADSLTASAQLINPNLNNSLNISSDLNSPDWLAAVIDRVPDLAANAQNAELDVSGTSVRLEGVVVSEELKNRLADDFAAAAGDGVSIVNNLQVLEAVEPAFTVKLNDDGSVELTGNVAIETAESLNQTAEGLSETLTTNLAAADNVAAPSWFNNVIGRIPDFKAQVADAELDVTAQTLTLNGVVTSEEEKAAIEAEFVAATGPGVSVQNNLRVELPETIAEPDAAALEPEFRVQLNDDGSVAMSGQLNPETASSLTELAAGVASDVTSNLAETPEISNPDWLNRVITRIPEFNSQVEDAALDVKGSTVTLTGRVASEELRETVAADIAEAAGEDVEIVNNLEVIAVQPVIAPKLNVRLNDDGSVELSGDVAPEIANSVTGMAAGLSESVNNDLAVGPTVAAPEWLANVIEQLPEFKALVSEAEVNIEGDTVRLNGVVGSEQEKADIAARFVEATGPGVSVINNLQVVRPDLVAPSLNVQVTEGSLKLRGQVAESTANLASDTANQLAETVENSLVSSSQVASPEWLTKVIDRLPGFADVVSQAELDVSGSTITLNGIVASEELKAAAEASFVEAAGPGISVMNNLRVVQAPAETSPEPVSESVAPSVSEPVAVDQAEQSPAQLLAPSIRMDCVADTVRLTGIVATEANKQLAASVFADKTSENLLELSADVAEPDYLSNALGIAPRVCSDLGRASLQLENDSLILSGVTLSNEQRDAIAAYVNDAVAPELNVINRLTVESLVPVSEDGK